MLFLDRKRLRALGAERHAGYRDARPYPHAVFDGFLGAESASELAARFPDPSHPDWVRRDYAEQRRLGQLQRSGFEGVDPSVRHFLGELNGMAFLDFLGALTGVIGLVGDPHYVGAGPSITMPGGHLALHADFNRDRTRDLERVVTVLYYFGAEWQDEWGGDLELWNADRSACEARYAPILDRLIVMAHGDTYWHGHPSPLACPEGRWRASISAYYYVARPATVPAHGAIWMKKD